MNAVSTRTAEWIWTYEALHGGPRLHPGDIIRESMTRTPRPVVDQACAQHLRPVDPAADTVAAYRRLPSGGYIQDPWARVDEQTRALADALHADPARQRRAKDILSPY